MSTHLDVRRAAARSLRERVDEIAQELVVAPVETELETYTEFCSAVAAAANGGRGRRTRAAPEPVSL